jgi:hypothetical protein
MPTLQHHYLLAQTKVSAISSAFGLKIAAMAKTSSRNTCAAVILARAPRR